jgi:inner membrane protein
MTSKTHQAFNLAGVSALCTAGIISLHSLSTIDAALIGGVALGGLLPDIDSPNSKIRHVIRRVLVPKALRRHITRAAMAGSSFHHRQAFTHWPLFWLCFGALVTVLHSDPLLSTFFLGVATGALAHLLCDMFNPYGILLLAPFSRKRISLAKIPTNSMGEVIFLSSLIATSMFLLTLALKH